MVTLTSAENALKSVYLNVLSEQLNINSNALLSKINQTSKDVFGKEIIKLAPFGLNGGIGAGTETGVLPTSAGHNFLQFKTGLKNLYGTISLSDKAIRASKSNTGAFVNLLNDEMESLIKSSCFNLGRMVYGDGTGLIGVVKSVSGNTAVMNSVKNFVEGMKVDFYNGENAVLSGVVVSFVDRKQNQVSFSSALTGVAENYACYVSLSKDNEITGIKRIFDTTEQNKILYGVDRTNYKWLYPYICEHETATEINDVMIQKALNSIEENTGNQVDFIAVSGDVRNAYQQYLSEYRRNIDVTTLASGYKAMTYAGVPVVYERLIEDGTMYLLNTRDFNIHQLCDWEWLEGDNGNILIPSANTPTYSATLVKYAELICDRPGAQGKISNIKTETNA
ncbi:MAG: phage major capsid protein [Clostridia bacterium]|nr:phage major capsid protein [Clostridia bacterium]